MGLTVRISGLTALLLVWLFLPFLPGGYDPLALTLSVAAQFAGLSTVFFAPIGAAWLLFGRRQHVHFAMAAVAAAAAMATLASVSALATGGGWLAMAVAAPSAFGLSCAVRAAKRLKGREAFTSAPLYLVIVPTAVALAHLLFLGRAIEISRNLVMANSRPMIAAIEKHRETHGEYPASLQSLHGDYDPGVIGIERYHYQRNGEGYDLYFEQFSNRLGTREIVMYNSRGEHLFPAHDADILEWTPSQLRARQGYYAVHDTAMPHWKYFWFD